MKPVLRSIGMLCASAALLGGSATLLQKHLMALRETSDVSLPLAAELPPLERRLKVLSEQVDLSEVQSALRSGSPQEKLQQYVLPKGADTTRLLAFFDVTRLQLEKQGMIRSLSPIQVGERQEETLPAAGNAPQLTVFATPVTFEAQMTRQGSDRLLALLDLSGLLTVGDALSSEQVERLFTLTEAENPAGIVTLEKFLSSDLLSYAREPKAYEDQLFQSFSSEQFLSAFRGLLEQSRLKDAKEILSGDWGKAYATQNVWPTQFLTVDTVRTDAMDQEWQTVKVTVKAYSR